MIKIVSSEFIKSAVKPIDYFHTELSELAVVGKSNVGKSSLINTLLNRKKIAKVSSTPGKTRLINFFEVIYKLDEESHSFILTDLPGYGYAKVSKTERESWKKMVSDYFENRTVLKLVIFLLDIRHIGDEKDRTMIEMMSYYKIPFLIVCTKADKIGKTKIKGEIKKATDWLGTENVISFSSKSRSGLEKLLKGIEAFVV